MAFGWGSVKCEPLFANDNNSTKREHRLQGGALFIRKANMAIQHRRGVYNKLDPARLVSGEWAVVQSGAQDATNGQAAYICFAPGQVKRVATVEDMATIIANAEPEVSQNITDYATKYVQEAEAARVEAERGRAAAETKRVTAETARAAAETSRENAEHTREVQEVGRDTDESARREAEAARATAETARAKAESERQAAETARTAAESARAAAESERQANEVTRQQALADMTQATGEARSATTATEAATTAAQEATTRATNVNATLSGTELTVTDRDGNSVTSDVRGPQGEVGPQGPRGDGGDVATVETAGVVKASPTVAVAEDGTMSVSKDALGLGSVADLDQSKAIRSITRSGTTFTATALDGTTTTFDQQDSNTTDLGAMGGTLPISHGGTGATDAVSAMRALGGGKALIFTDGEGGNLHFESHDGTVSSELDSYNNAETRWYRMHNGTVTNYTTMTDDQTYHGKPLSVSSGGTGATDAALARANLGVNASNLGLGLQQVGTSVSAEHWGLACWRVGQIAVVRCSSDSHTSVAAGQSVTVGTIGVHAAHNVYAHMASSSAGVGFVNVKGSTVIVTCTSGGLYWADVTVAFEIDN